MRGQTKLWHYCRKLGPCQSSALNSAVCIQERLLIKIILCRVFGISLLSLERRLSPAKRTDLANALFGMLLRVWTNLTVKPPQYYIQYTYLAPAQTYIPSCFRRELNCVQRGLQTGYKATLIAYKSGPPETEGLRDFGRYVNPIQIRIEDCAHQITSPPPFSNLPTALLVGVMSHALRPHHHWPSLYFRSLNLTPTEIIGKGGI